MTKKFIEAIACFEARNKILQVCNKLLLLNLYIIFLLTSLKTIEN